MKIKSYYAATVEAAMSRARRELGGEAMLVQSRRAPIEARHLGEYEVVFAGEEQASEEPAPPPAVETVRNSGPLAAELAVMRTQIEEMRKAISRSGSNFPAWLSPHSPLADIYAMLVQQEVEGPLAQQIVLNIQNRKGAKGSADTDFESAARAELASVFKVEATLGRAGTPAMAALVGPPGAGKTSLVAKLAVRFGLHGRRSTQLFALDSHRVGSAEQLRIYAGLLGVGFQSVESVRALAQGIEECRNKELILIDTPGFAPADFDEAGELVRLLSNRPEIDVHLALPASMKAADMIRTAERYDVFRPAKLIFTRLDETVSFGPLVNLAVRAARPLSFLTGGQRVPEDLEAASASRVLDLILPERAQGSALSAA